MASAASHPSFGPIKELASQLSYVLPDDIQLFGENMFGIHSIEYDELQSFFYVFAGLKDGTQWMSWDDITQLANDLDLPTVPVIARQMVRHINYYVYSCGDFLQFSSFKGLQEVIIKAMGKSQCGKRTLDHNHYMIHFLTCSG